MLLAINVNNTNIKFGAYETEGGAAGTLVHSWRAVTNRQQTEDEMAALVDAMLRLGGISRAAVTRIVIASVVPQLYRAVTAMGQRYFGCRAEFISAARQSLMPVRIPRPAELGADLIAGALGGVAKYGAPLIVVDFGTATTYAAIDGEGAYVGTAISPGIEVSFDALTARAAKLSSVPLVPPPAAIGTDTTSALQSGIIIGTVGQVEHLIARIRAELGTQARAVATGGLADVVAPHARSIDVVDERLVLDGLYRWAASSVKAPR